MARKEASKAVLFADVSESGSIYQQLGDTAARHVINTCIAGMAELLPQFQGVLVKTLGDAVMCAFPSADLGVRAAGEMQALVLDSPPAGYPIGIHVGLAYGAVLMEEADVFGDTVNVAAYLTAIATRDQILTTEATENALSPALKSCARPVFHTLLKGAPRESLVYQILWKTDGLEITEVSLRSDKIVPGDTGSLVISLKDERVRVNHLRQSISIGRDEDCDLVVSDSYASRRHATIRLNHARFYLIDHSINGTFVTLEGGQEMQVLRSELPLDNCGEVYLGRSASQKHDERISFKHDQRSIYRV